MNKKELKKQFPFLFTAYWKLYDIFLTIMGKVSPKWLSSFVYKRECHKKLNWKVPEDLNQKIHVLQFTKYAEQWPLFADHYGVREYVKQKGLSNILIPLFGVWERAEDIDFDKLPNSFVLKTNHGCGEALFVKNKKDIDQKEACQKLNQWLKEKTGLLSAEFHYLKIEPKIMAVELLNNDNIGSTSIVDYKVWCFDGEPYCIMVCANRTRSSVEMSFFDLEWNSMPDVLDGHHKYDKLNIKKPECLEEMLYASRLLSEGQPQMRVDFYEIGGKLYFGELTLSSLGGNMDYISPKYLKIMGDKAIIR